jgi:hypothetical protein
MALTKITNVKTDTNYCSMQLSKKCQKKEGHFPLSEFYSASDVTIYKNGKFNICKTCLKEYVYDNGEINLSKFKTILRIFDLPFLEKEFTSALEGKAETIGTYFSNIQLNHAGEHWLDGDELQTKIIDNEVPKNAINHEEFADKELIKNWGYGFSLEELHWLEDDYEEWLGQSKDAKLPTKKLIRMICIKELEIRKAIQNGDVTDKLEKSLLNLMDNSSLTPKTMDNSNETDSSKVYGAWVRDIEKYRPAEYFQDKKIYFDFDKIGEYFQRFTLRPLKNLLTGSRDFDKEFSIEEDNGEDNE